MLLKRTVTGFVESVFNLTKTENFLAVTCDFQQCGILTSVGAQWLSGRVLDSRPKGRGFEPHRRHCVVVLEQDTFILA